MTVSSSTIAASGGQGARPKVVFVNRYFHPDESATSRMLSDLAFRLAAADVSVSVVTSRQLYDDPHALLPARELVGGVDVHRVQTSTRGRAHLVGRAFDYLSFHISAGVRLLALVRRGDVVVAKTDPPLISVIAAQVAYLRRARLVNWLQDVFPEVASALGMSVTPGWLASLTTAARNQSLRYASANVVLGERMRDYVRSLGVAAEHIRVVPNWADIQEIEPRPVERSALRTKLGLSDRFVVGYFGNLGRAHEFQTLLGAARLLRAEPRFAFLINGGGAKVDELRRTAESEGLEAFHFQTYQPRELLADSLAAADVHLISLLPSLEGLIVPSKLYGILAAGRPTVFIGDPQGEVARVLREHDCGVVVEIGASERLAEDLRSLCAVPQRVAAMGQKARDLAVARYGSHQAVADWLRLLQDTAGHLQCKV
jgi:glycosyltransferase involved in cell wall biosynthesis